MILKKMKTKNLNIIKPKENFKKKKTKNKLIENGSPIIN